jgi:hypothetical protein
MKNVKVLARKLDEIIPLFHSGLIEIILLLTLPEFVNPD